MRTTRRECLALDDGDGLAALGQRFALPEGVIYLDGNSLGPMARQIPARLEHVVEDEWGRGLIRSWNDAGWIDAPRRTSARVARIVGADADEVTVADSTSVNLFKLLVAAARLRPDRNVLLSVSGDFPTDRYIAESVAEILGLRAHCAGPEPDALIAALDERVAVLALSHVDYRTGRINPMSRLTAAAHAAGAVALWDVSHSAGVIDIGLNAAHVDFAVGCGYKYLNGGPGAPAFVYVARRHHELIQQPLTGWLGHAQPFAFADAYVPAKGIDRLQCGTPPMMSLLALEAALEAFDGVDLTALRRKSQALGDLFIRLIDERLGPYGFALASPRDRDVRGSQVSLAHPRAYAVMQALIARGIIGDYRAPDILRFGLAPLFVRFADIFDTAAAIDEIMTVEEWNQPRFLSPKAVT
jgi:kynureninase